MAVLKTPAPNLVTGRRALKHTDKITLVSARDVMATVQDAMRQARAAGMRTATTNRERNGKSVVIVAFAVPNFDVVADRGTFYIDGRAITDAHAWSDLRDVMAESEIK